MTIADTTDRGRQACARREWAEAFALLSAADRERALSPEDLALVATAAYLVGRDADSAALWARAHQGFLDRRDVGRAARCAFWLAFGLLHAGERARGGAWIARARRLLDDSRHDCVEQGYLLLPAALEALLAGDLPGAHATFCQAATIGERFGDPDLIALARHSRGRALIRMGEIREGVSLLDEAMVAIDAGDVSPMAMGDVYCSVIEGCLEIFDLRRAQEWTAALSRWCDAQPDLVPYSGQCLVRRAEILQLHGQWPDALEAARRAGERFLRASGPPATGAAFYQQAELHRLRGEFAEAEEAYRQASRFGRTPQPGLAQLRLARGQFDAAATAIRRAVEDARVPASRTRLLAAHVEIMLAVGDVEAARLAADELAQFAGRLDARLLDALAAQARGAVLLADHDAHAAVDALRAAWTAWQAIEAPYEAARVRILIGLAHRALGDLETADMELDAARWALQQLGARPDLARVAELCRKPPRVAGPLTAREVEVVRLVASGRTNRAIAAELGISERTVERHLSNIFTKLDLSSRAAATAYAYEHHLV